MVPSVLDLPMSAKLLVMSKKFDSIVCIGYHDNSNQNYNGASTTNVVDIVVNSLIRLSVDYNVHCIPAIASGQLTGDNSIETSEENIDAQNKFYDRMVQIGKDSGISAISVGAARAELFRLFNGSSSRVAQFVNFSSSVEGPPDASSDIHNKRGKSVF